MVRYAAAAAGVRRFASDELRVAVLRFERTRGPLGFERAGTDRIACIGALRLERRGARVGGIAGDGARARLGITGDAWSVLCAGIASRDLAVARARGWRFVDPWTAERLRHACRLYAARLGVCVSDDQ